MTTETQILYNYINFFLDTVLLLSSVKQMELKTKSKSLSANADVTFREVISPLLLFYNYNRMFQKHVVSTNGTFPFVPDLRGVAHS